MSVGRLAVRAYLADGALPIEGVLVRVYGTNEGESGIERSGFTDMDGIWGPTELPAPQRSYSESPHPKEQPYSTYRVTALKEGYYPKVISEVAVFEGGTTLMPINMIIYVEGEPAPLGTLDSESTEPETLE